MNKRVKAAARVLEELSEQRLVWLRGDGDPPTEAERRGEPSFMEEAVMVLAAADATPAPDTAGQERRSNLTGPSKGAIRTINAEAYRTPDQRHADMRATIARLETRLRYIANGAEGRLDLNDLACILARQGLEGGET